MSKILLNNLTYSQPQGRVAIASRFDLDSAFFFPSSPGIAVDLVRGYTAEHPPSVSFVPSDRGVAAKYSGAVVVGTALAAGSFTEIIPIASPFWVVIAFRVETTGTRRILYSDFNSGGQGNSVAVLFEQTASNTYRWYIGSPTPYTVTHSAPVTVGWHVAVLDFAPGGPARMSLDGGAFESSAVGSGSRYAGTRLRAGSAGELTSIPFNGQIETIAVSRLMLPDDVLRSIGSDPWQLFRDDPEILYFDVPTPSGTALFVADMMHGLLVDSQTLSTGTTFSVADSLHASSVDNLGLSIGVSVSVDEVLHAHAVDNVTVTADSVLAVSDLTHGQTSDNLVVNTGLSLSLADMYHGQESESLTLTTLSVLVLEDLTHANLTDAVVITTSDVLTLTVSDSGHAHLMDNLGLSTLLSLSINESTHGHIVDSVDLLSGSALSINGLTHSLSVDSLVLTTMSELLIQESQHSFSMDSIGLVFGGFLSIEDVEHLHTADNLGLSIYDLLAVQDVAHSHLSDSLVLTTDQWLQINESLHASRLDNVLLNIFGLTLPPVKCTGTHALAANVFTTVRPL